MLKGQMFHWLFKSPPVKLHKLKSLSIIGLILHVAHLTKASQATP